MFCFHCRIEVRCTLPFSLPQLGFFLAWRVLELLPSEAQSQRQSLQMIKVSYCYCIMCILSHIVLVPHHPSRSSLFDTSCVPSAGLCTGQCCVLLLLPLHSVPGLACNYNLFPSGILLHTPITLCNVSYMWHDVFKCIRRLYQTGVPAIYSRLHISRPKGIYPPMRKEWCNYMYHVYSLVAPDHLLGTWSMAGLLGQPLEYCYH